MTSRKNLCAIAAAVCLSMLAPAAQATLALRLSDGINTVTVFDGGAGDLNAAAGAVTFIGGIGDFELNVSTALGDARTSFMGIHLDSVSSSLVAGSLTVMMTENGLNFGASGPTGIVTSFGGIAGGNVRGQMYVDDGDALFNLGSQVFDSGVLGSGAFATSGWGLSSLTDPFSMTMLVNITHPGSGGATSFNFEGRVPEPGSLALFGIGLLGLGATARRRAKA